MRKIREILRLDAEGRSKKQIAQLVGAGRTTVREALKRAEVACVTWPLPDDVSDSELEAMLYPPPTAGERPLPDWKQVRRELARKGVTLQLLHAEYEAEHEGLAVYSYNRFVELFKAWRRDRVEPVMRQVHHAGERLFVDWAGMTVPIVDPGTGVVSERPVFVGALGASNFTFARVMPSMELAHWTMVQVMCLEAIGGVPELIVPDNPKTAVSKACWYEPEVHPVYEEMASHYGVAVLPARPRKPRDKAKVESAVLIVERSVLAPLRNQTFLSIADANEQITRLVDKLNDRPMQGLDASRRELLERVDRPALRQLPRERWQYAERRVAKVGPSYHVKVDGHHYSVPHALGGERVIVRASARTIEILHDSRRVTSHPRSYVKNGYTTTAEHMPSTHRHRAKWTPERMLRWAASTGPHTERFVEQLMNSKTHPEQGFQAAQGIMRLARQCGDERVEAACQRALIAGACSYKSIATILERGLDRQPLPDPAAPTRALPAHSNVRGSDYYACTNQLTFDP